MKIEYPFKFSYIPVSNEMLNRIGFSEYYSMFDTKEKAMSFLNEWLDRRGVDSVSVWTNNKINRETRWM